MILKMGLCSCTINDDDVKFWENLTPPPPTSVVSDCIGIVMKDGSRYVYKEGTGLMYMPPSMGVAFYESFRKF